MQIKELYRNLDVDTVLQPPREKGALICGAEVTQTLNRLLRLGDRLGIADTFALGLVAKLIQELESAELDKDIKNRGGSRLTNFITVAPRWACLVPFRIEPPSHPLDIIRLLTLLAQIRLWHPSARDSKKLTLRVTEERITLAGRLTRPRPRTLQPILETAKIITWHLNEKSIPNVDLDSENNVTQDVVGVEQIRSHLKALQHLLVALSDQVAQPIARRGVSRASAGEQETPATAQKPTAPANSTSAHMPRRPPPGPRSFQGDIVAPPGFDCKTSGLSRSDACHANSRVRGANTSAQSTDSPSSKRRTAHSEFRMWLLDQCFPGSARVVSDQEFLASISLLRKLAVPERNGPIAESHEGAIILSLSAFTSRHEQQVQFAQSYLPGMPILPRQLYFYVKRGLWLARLPEPEDRWEPPVPIRREGLNCHAEGYHSWSEVVVMPLPTWLAALLPKLPNHAGNALFSAAGAATISTLKEQLILEVSPNVTPARLRPFVSAKLIQGIGDVTAAQALSAQPMGFSPAGLSYWASKIDVFVKNYLEAFEGCGPFVPTPARQAGDAKYLAISRLTLLCDDPIHAMVSTLQTNLQNTINAKTPRPPLDHLNLRLDQLSALCAYSMALSEANAGGRLTHWLDHQTVDDLVFDHYLLDEYSMRRRRTKQIDCNQQEDLDKANEPARPAKGNLARLADSYYQAVGVRRDKIMPPVNLSRIIAISPLAVQQHIAWLEALAEFADFLEGAQLLNEEVRDTLLMAVRNALSGRGPVFLRRDGVSLVPATMNWLREFLPTDVADNFLRHRLSRRLVELGAPALDVSIHLGHHFFGAPFGNDSLYTPQTFSRRLGPILDQYLRQDGWQLLRLPGTLGRCWQHYLTIDWDCWSRHRADCNRLDEALRQSRKQFHKVRKESLARVDEAIQGVLTSLVPGFTLAQPTSDVSLDDPTLNKIILGVQGQMDTDVLREIAARRLQFWIRSFIQLHKWKSNLPGLIYPRLQPHDVVSREHTRAARIIRQVRRILANEHERAQLSPAQIKPWQGIGSPSADLVQAFVASLLFDCGVTNQDAILAALRGLPELVTTPSLRGAAIIPLLPAREVHLETEAEDSIKHKGESKTGSMAIAGRPLALALLLRTALKSEDPAARPEFPRMRSQLTDVLRAALPAAIRGNHSVVWETYANVVEMGLRLEVAGPLPLSSRSGINATLPVERLLGLLTNELRPVRTVTAAPNIVRTKNPVRGELAKDLEEYSQLTSALNELTHIGNSATRSHAVNLINADLEPMDEENSAQSPQVQTITRLSLHGTPNVRLLSKFAIHLLKRKAYKESRRAPSTGDGKKSRRGPKLEPSSVHGYVTRFGRAILLNLDGRDLTGLDEEDIIGIFRAAIYSKSISEQRYCYDRIGEFYHFLRDHGWIAQVSLGEVLEDLPDIQTSCEAAFVTQVEFNLALQQLRHWFAQAKKLPEPDQKPLQRLIRASAIIMTLMYRLGLRSGESRRLRFADLIQVGSSQLIHAHTNQLGRVKSFHSNRAPDFALWATAVECKALANWVADEQNEQGKLRGRNINPIFAKMDDSRHEFEAWRLMDIITEALKIATGDPDARPHWLRHSRAMNWLSPYFIPERVGMGFDTFVASPLPAMHPALYGLWICRQLGHSRLVTSLRCYEHVRQLSTMYRQIKDQRRLTTKEMAQTSGIDALAIRQRCEGLNHKHGYGRHWHHAVRSYILWHQKVHLIKGQRRKRRLRSQLPFSKPTRKHLTLDALLSCLGDIQRLERLPAIQRTYGLTRHRVHALLDCLLNWHVRSGYWLVPPRHLEQLRRELGAKVPLLRLDRGPSAAARIQLEPVRALLQKVSAITSAEWRDRREHLGAAMRIFREDRFDAVTHEQITELEEVAGWFGLAYDGSRFRINSETGDNITVSDRHLFCGLLMVEAMLMCRRSSAEDSSTTIDTFEAFQL